MNTKPQETKPQENELDYDLLYDILLEKYQQEFSLFELTKNILNREVFIEQKIMLTKLEHQLLLIRKQKQNG